MNRIDRAIRIIAFLAALLISYIEPSFAATLLPPGEITFLDANGAPLANGKVYFYIPSTSTPKDTWQDSGQTVLNTNPVVLDSAGRAIIYGSGSYRQVVEDSLGNVIWDQLTADTAPTTNTVWGGTSFGSANAQQILASDFTSGTGQIISFLAGYSNTAAATLAVGGGSGQTVVKNTPSGTSPLTGGEINAGDISQVLWDGTEFVLLNPNNVIIGPLTNLASAATTNLGTIPSHNVNVTGTTTITSFGSSAVTNYPIYYLQFAASLTITYNATSMITPGGRSIVTQAGDTATVEYLGSGNWQIRSYTPQTPQIALPPQGRLTLTSGVPVLTSDVTAAGTVYYTPYLGNSLPVYNGVGWTMSTFSELSLTLNNPAHAINSNYDLFVASDSGTLRLCTGPAWVSDTSRGTGAGTTQIAINAGFYSNVVSMTCRYGASTFTVAANYGLYVGTFRTTGIVAQTEMTFAPAAAAGGTNNHLFLWNMYNRVPIAAVERDSTDTWVYASSTIRSENGNANNSINVLVGLNEDRFEVVFSQQGVTANSVVDTQMAGIGLDSNSAIASGSLPGIYENSYGNSSIVRQASSYYKGLSGLGFHTFYALEATPTNTVTYIGDNGDPTKYQSGLTLSGRM